MRSKSETMRRTARIWTLEFCLVPERTQVRATYRDDVLTDVQWLLRGRWVGPMEFLLA